MINIGNFSCHIDVTSRVTRLRKVYKDQFFDIKASLLYFRNLFSFALRCMLLFLETSF